MNNAIDKKVVRQKQKETNCMFKSLFIKVLFLSLCSDQLVLREYNNRANHMALTNNYH
jgi:hypothetical protein